MVDSRNSFLFRGCMSTLEGCGATKANQRHKGLTLFSGEKPLPVCVDIMGTRSRTLASSTTQDMIPGEGQ
jgi:hypothetical protein